MTIQELMEKRAKVWEAAKNFVDTHENENGVPVCGGRCNL